MTELQHYKQMDSGEKVHLVDVKTQNSNHNQNNIKVISYCVNINIVISILFFIGLVILGITTNDGNFNCDKWKTVPCRIEPLFNQVDECKVYNILNNINNDTFVNNIDNCVQLCDTHIYNKIIDTMCYNITEAIFGQPPDLECPKLQCQNPTMMILVLIFVLHMAFTFVAFVFKISRIQ